MIRDYKLRFSPFNVPDVIKTGKETLKRTAILSQRLPEGTFPKVLSKSAKARRD